MPTEKTNNLEITYLAQNQTNKEILINEGFLKIDSILNKGAMSKSTATPPSNPNDGDLYIIPANATDEWSGEGDKFTYYNTEKGWVILTPNEGMTLWVNNVDALYTYNGSSWIPSGEVESLDKLGINATADSTNKLAVKSDAILLDNDGGNSQVKINKAADTDTASYLFQTNYSGRAEFGLTGDDDFHVKVSENGNTWNESIVIDKSIGDITVKENITSEKTVTGRLNFGTPTELTISSG